MQNIRLDTQRLTIRQFSQQDAQGYFRLLNNPQVHCFVSEKLESIEQARDKIQEISKIPLDGFTFGSMFFGILK